MLAVPALELRDPMLLVVEVESDDAARRHGQPRFSWMKRGLRWTSSCTSGPSPIPRNP
jgi:hypothetical protein